MNKIALQKISIKLTKTLSTKWTLIVALYN